MRCFTSLNKPTTLKRANQLLHLVKGVLKDLDDFEFSFHYQSLHFQPQPASPHANQTITLARNMLARAGITTSGTAIRSSFTAAVVSQ